MVNHPLMILWNWACPAPYPEHFHKFQADWSAHQVAPILMVVVVVPYVRDCRPKKQDPLEGAEICPRFEVRDCKQAFSSYAALPTCDTPVRTPCAPC